MDILVAALIGAVLGGGIGWVAGFLFGCICAVASGRDRTAHDATVYAEGYADGRSS